jgi:hypothetical protein
MGNVKAFKHTLVIHALRKLVAQQDDLLELPAGSAQQGTQHMSVSWGSGLESMQINQLHTSETLCLRCCLLDGCCNED